MEELDAIRYRRLSRLFGGKCRITVLVYAKQRAMGRLLRKRPRLSGPRAIKDPVCLFVPQMEELAAGLAALGLLGTARRNDLAGLFALEVGIDQLVALSRLPAVRRIEPNRINIPLEGGVAAGSYADFVAIRSALGIDGKALVLDRQPDRIKRDVDRMFGHLNSGAIDDILNRRTPEGAPRESKMFVDVKPFSLRRWKRGRRIP